MILVRLFGFGVDSTSGWLMSEKVETYRDTRTMSRILEHRNQWLCLLDSRERFSSPNKPFLENNEIYSYKNR